VSDVEQPPRTRDGSVTGHPDAEAKEIEIEVTAALEGLRLDRALALIASVSRAEAATWLRSGQVRLDGRVHTDGGRRLRPGNVVAVRAVASGQARPSADPDVPFALVHEDPAVIVVDKPAGVIVHPGAGHRSGTLVSGLLARFADLWDLVEDGTCPPERPGIVHRLDRGTSGLMVVARTAEAYHALVRQLSQRTVQRRYLALVSGRIAEARGLIDAPIGRSSTTPTKMAVRAEGRPARTAFEVIEHLSWPAPGGPDVVTLVRVSLETGRTHQIRVHFAAIGHPVIGDDRYGRAGSARPEGARAARHRGDRMPIGAELASSRPLLHAFELCFDHPRTGERLRFESRIPADFAAVLNGLTPSGRQGTEVSGAAGGTADPPQRRSDRLTPRREIRQPRARR